MSAPQEQEVRFMYLTSQGNEAGWRNWEGGESFIKKFNHVLNHRKDEKDFDFEIPDHLNSDPFDDTM